MLVSFAPKLKLLVFGGTSGQVNSLEYVKFMATISIIAKRNGHF